MTLTTVFDLVVASSDALQCFCIHLYLAVIAELSFLRENHCSYIFEDYNSHKPFSHIQLLSFSFSGLLIKSVLLIFDHITSLFLADA